MGIGDEPMLPGAALVEFGRPGPGVVRGIEPGIALLGEDDIGRGAIVIVPGIDVPGIDDPGIDDPGIACEPPIVPCEPPIMPVPGWPPRATAVARHTYMPLPLPQCVEPFM